MKSLLFFFLVFAETTSFTSLFVSKSNFFHQHDNGHPSLNVGRSSSSSSSSSSSTNNSFFVVQSSSTTMFDRISQSKQQLILRKASNTNNNDEQKNESSENDYDELDTQILSKVQNHFKSNLLYTFTLPHHKPLGCTAEESLAQGDDGEKFVFISKLVAGGHAATAGLEVGDLVVGLSGTFDVVEDTFGEGLDRVRSLVAGRPEEDNLIIKIIRNTDVMQKHESALVDLCIIPEGQLNVRDKNIETCIETMYKAGFEIDDTDSLVNSCEDDDLECMFDQLTDLWDEDYDFSSIEGKKKEKEESSPDDSQKENNAKKPAPWSSRSSPSGTWVRVNGTMTNIDE